MNARRDIGWIDQWVLVHNPTKLLDSEAKRYGVSVEYFIGFVYVDQEAGLTIDIESYCNVNGSTIVRTCRLNISGGVCSVSQNLTYSWFSCSINQIRTLATSA